MSTSSTHSPHTTPTISIIIPVYHEADRILTLLSTLDSTNNTPFELIVVDGAPEQDTLAQLSGTTAIPLPSPPGRAVQMNHGAAIATGDILLFLHADTELPPGGLTLIQKALQDPQFKAGAFDLAITPATWGLRLIAATATLRSRWTRVPYGDQAQFFRADYFRAIGGYAEIPIMEDMEIMERIRDRGEKIVLLRPAVRTSGRRWKKEGVVRGTLRNWYIRMLYHFGVGPERLVGLYRVHKKG
ncbi:MAG TPA: TIGR04283 family arsenosugar biosynthesis glycosyltransferase [Desulfomicrobiaceae bacterium]|nr:TIGR04283 family arsenosugar biosynthesis glycosyltransferase [Desulfomicrobiaceae bacterium]